MRVSRLYLSVPVLIIRESMITVHSSSPPTAPYNMKSACSMCYSQVHTMAFIIYVSASGTAICMIKYASWSPSYYIERGIRTFPANAYLCSCSGTMVILSPSSAAICYVIAFVRLFVRGIVGNVETRE